LSYNLLDEKWIPVLYHDGKWERLGIRRTLADAHRIRQIAASNPMDRVAIIRFLLAGVFWGRKRKKQLQKKWGVTNDR